MSYFAVGVTGGSLANSLTSANVGNRSLTCLGLTGQVSLLYTPTQIKAGVPVSLAAGEYTFTIIGFSNAASGFSSVTDMYSRSPSVGAFFISQLTAKVVPGQALKLISSYNGGTAPDLNNGCRLPNGILYALTLSNTFPRLYRKSGGSWTNDLLPDGGASFGGASLAVDSSGNAMAALNTGTGVGVSFSMLPNVYQQIATNVQTNGSNGVAIAVTEDGVRHAIANFYGGSASSAAEYSSNGGAWVRGADVFTGGPFPYQSMRAVAGPNNTVVASANVSSPGTPMDIAVKGSNGVWGPVGVVGDVGGTSCAAGVTKTALAFDSQGFAYGAYVCGAAQDKIGIVHNRSGTWANFLAINANGTAINDVDLYIVGGTMHLVFNGAADVLYTSSLEGSAVFSPPTVIRNIQTDAILQLGIVGADASHLHVMGMESTSNGLRLTHTTNETGTWQSEVVAATLGAGDTLQKRIFLR